MNNLIKMKGVQKSNSRNWKISNNSKGITLMSLVITVIILLILAGIGINAIMSSEGLLAKTKEAGDMYNKSADDENKKIQELLNLISKEENKSKELILVYNVNAGEEINIELLANSQSMFDGTQLTYSYDATIDYGDGNTGEIKSATELKHTYETEGQYIVKIKGKLEYFKIANAQPLIEVMNWGEVGLKNFNIWTESLLKIPEPLEKSFTNMVNFDETFGSATYLGSCKNLTSIPKGLFANCINVTSFRFTFAECSGLLGEIPKDLFANCPNVTSFMYTFYGCSSLTGDIPEELFENSLNATSFECTFLNCSGLKGSIPEGLFTNNSKVTIFRNTFSNCSGLTGSIPESLFANCSYVKDFNSTFFNCSGLTGSIPTRLFENCTNVTSFRSIFSLCIGLTGNIPEGLFVNCLDAIDFDSVFSKCSGLTGSIPEDLFANNSKVTDFKRAFSGCIGLTGNAPNLWNNATVKTFKECFKDCTKLSNYASIPSDWK